MPIVGEGKNVSIEYEIPSEIESKIPPYFYHALAGELFSVFSSEALQKDGEGFYGLPICFGGTAGWAEALKATCRKLDMTWLWDYYSTLEWYDSDLFDEKIEERIISKVVEAEPSSRWQ